MKTATFACSVLFFFLLSPLASGQLDESQIRDKLTAATVVVLAQQPDGDVFRGTGWILSTSRKQIVTADHVITGATSLSIVLPARDANGLVVSPSRLAQLPHLSAKLIRTDRAADVALLQVANLPSHMPELTLAEEFPAVDSQIFLVGHPGKSSNLYQFLSGVMEGRGFDASTVYKKNETQRYRADIIAMRTEGVAHGASGAAVTDGSGNVIGLVSGGVQQDPTFCRVVSMLEIKRVLGSASLNKTGVPRSLVGRWICTLPKGEVEFAFEFDANRKVKMMLPNQVKAGTYRMGQAKLYFTTNRKTETALIEWLDDDHFIMTDSSSVVRFERYDGGWKE